MHVTYSFHPVICMCSMRLRFLDKLEKTCSKSAQWGNRSGLWWKSDSRTQKIFDYFSNLSFTLKTRKKSRNKHMWYSASSCRTNQIKKKLMVFLLHQLFYSHIRPYYSREITFFTSKNNYLVLQGANPSIEKEMTHLKA